MTLGWIELISIGLAIVAFSIIVAIVVVRIQDNDGDEGRIALSDDEENLLDDDEPLPLYDRDPPPYSEGIGAHGKPPPAYEPYVDVEARIQRT